MAWAKTRSGGGKVNPKYATPEHIAQRNAYRAQLARDGHAWCAQPICLMRTRLILPGMRWATGHDSTGTVYIGLVHKKCNDSDGGRRARHKQTTTARRM